MFSRQCMPCNMLFSCVPTGRYSGLCQTLQRHLRVLGVRLPAGSHMSDTSLLLGGHQSQLPRKQLRLDLDQLSEARRGRKCKFLSYFIISFSPYSSDYRAARLSAEAKCVGVFAWRNIFGGYVSSFMVGRFLILLSDQSWSMFKPWPRPADNQEWENFKSGFYQMFERIFGSKLWLNWTVLDLSLSATSSLCLHFYSQIQMRQHPPICTSYFMQIKLFCC